MNNNDWDPLLSDAAWLIVSEQNTSTSMLQRRMKLGYSRAGRLLDQMEALGIVGPFKGTTSRELYVKGEVALINILDGAGIPHTSFHDINLKSDHPDLVNNEDTSTDLPNNHTISNQSAKSSFSSIFLFLCFLGFIFIMSDSGFGRQIASQLNMSMDDYQSFFTLIIIGGVTFFLWSIRNTKLGFLWDWYKLFWIMLFAVLLVNYAKKQLKEWWRKD